MSTCWQVILTSVEWRAPRVLRVRLAPFAGEQGEGAPLGPVGWGAFLAEPRHCVGVGSAPGAAPRAFTLPQGPAAQRGRPLPTEVRASTCPIS